MLRARFHSERSERRFAEWQRRNAHQLSGAGGRADGPRGEPATGDFSPPPETKPAAGTSPHAALPLPGAGHRRDG